MGDEQLSRGLAAHREEIRKWMTAAPYVEFIEINYRRLVHDAHKMISQIVEFVGTENLPARERMAGVIDRSLYRQNEASAGVEEKAPHA